MPNLDLNPRTIQHTTYTLVQSKKTKLSGIKPDNTHEPLLQVE